MASIAPGAKATTISANRTWVVMTMTATKIAVTTTATANEPSPALTWLSRVFAFMRANLAPINAPMPTSATPRTQGGRPPSTTPAPCSTLDAIIAPNIQLAGNLIQCSSSATATEAAINSASATGEAIASVLGGGVAGARPVKVSSIGNAAV